MDTPKTTATNKPKLTALAISVVVVVAAIVGYIIFLNTFRLTGSNPKNNATNIDIPNSLTLTFSKDLDATTTPSLVTTNGAQTSLAIAGNSLTVSFTKPLDYATKYSFTFGNITSASGKVISTLTVNFSTMSLPESTVQLRQSLPYTTNNFSVDYTASSQTYSVTILQGPVDQAKTAALNYLATYNITPTNSTISFYVVPGVEGSTAVGP